MVGQRNGVSEGLRIRRRSKNAAPSNDQMPQTPAQAERLLPNRCDPNHGHRSRHPKRTSIRSLIDGCVAISAQPGVRARPIGRTVGGDRRGVCGLMGVCIGGVGSGIVARRNQKKKATAKKSHLHAAKASPNYEDK